MSSNSKTAIVVGAGLSGLSAAYHLVKNGWQVRVFEAGNYAGGRANTITRQGYLVDTGATAMATSYVAYLQVAGELGLSQDVVDVSPYVAIYRDGRLHELALDHMLSSGIRSKLLSWPAKLRMGLLIADVWRQRKLLDYNDMSKSAPLDNESTRSYALRVLGRELSDYLCDPLTRMMLIADGDKVSRVELFSAIANIFATRMQALKGGVNAFAQALASRLDISYQCPVTRVRDYQSHVEVCWQEEGAERILQADACVVACQLPEAQALCQDYQPQLAPLAGKVKYTSALTVAIGFTERPQTNAFVIPMAVRESPEIALLFLDHNKAPDRAPPGRFLINAHWETDASKAWFSRTDDEIAAKSLETILKVFPELDGSVDMTWVARWPRALPQTAPGVYQAIGEFNKSLDTRARVQFAADYMSAAGQNTAVEFGAKAAQNLVDSFGSATARTEP